MYQTEWLGLRFKDITRTSTIELAGPAFYEEFYRRFFETYSSYSDLPESWRQQKIEIARWIRERVSAQDEILSIGCGIGYIESVLVNGNLHREQLSVTEVSEIALRWIKRAVCSTRVHVGRIPESLPFGKKYDLAYLVAVEYALSDEELLALFKSLRACLREDGRLLLISASIEAKRAGGLDYVKDGAKWLLHLVHFRDLGQFWGWLRRPEEIVDLLQESGFFTKGAEKLEHAPSAMAFEAQVSG